MTNDVFNDFRFYRIIFGFLIICICFQPNKSYSQDSIQEEETGSLVISGGVYSILDTWASTGCFDVKLQPGCTWWVLKPQAGFLISFSGAYMIYAGITWPAKPVRWLIIETGAAMGYYENGEGIDLAYPLEFRLSLAVLYKFRNALQFGAEIVHISNADLGMPNPGTESLSVVLKIPLRKK